MSRSSTTTQRFHDRTTNPPTYLSTHPKDIRDDLVHAKRGEHLDNPDDPAVYGRLLAGDGSSCVEDAVPLAEAFRPDFLPPNVMEAVSSKPVTDA